MMEIGIRVEDSWMKAECKDRVVGTGTLHMNGTNRQMFGLGQKMPGLM